MRMIYRGPGRSGLAKDQAYNVEAIIGRQAPISLLVTTVFNGVAATVNVDYRNLDQFFNEWEAAHLVRRDRV